MAWRWYYEVQESEGEPEALAAGRLVLGHSPPAPYLALAQTWPEVSPEHRRLMLACLDANWPGTRLAQEWAPDYPALTAEVFGILLALHLLAPTALELAGQRAAAEPAIPQAAWLAL